MGTGTARRLQLEDAELRSLESKIGFNHFAPHHLQQNLECWGDVRGESVPAWPSLRETDRGAASAAFQVSCEETIVSSSSWHSNLQLSLITRGDEHLAEADEDEISDQELVI